MHLKEKHVLITGASSGLGEALARECAELGAYLTLSARRIERLKTLRDELLKAYPKAEIHIIKADVSDKDSCRNMIESSKNHFSKLDIFLANAGIGMWSRFRDIKDPDQIDDLMRVNFMGVVYGLFYSLTYLKETKGSFIAISSIQGMFPVAYHTAYVASKYAVNGLIDTIRLEEPDIHFLLALPSWISGTELRAHALSGDKQDAIEVKKSHGKHAVPAADCAEQIIKALLHRKREIFIPRKYRFLPILRDLFKSTFDRIVMDKIKGQLVDK